MINKDSKPHSLLQKEVELLVINEFMKIIEIIGVALFTMILNIPYSLIAPIVPLEFIRRDISQLSIGFFFALYGLAQILTPYFAYRAARHHPLVRVA